jgi:hypothetical protein
MIEWRRGEVFSAQNTPAGGVYLPGLLSAHLGIVKTRTGYTLLHAPTGLRITHARLQREARWLAEQIVDQVAPGGTPNELTSRITPTMKKWERHGRAPWEDTPEVKDVPTPEVACEAGHITWDVGPLVVPEPPVSRALLARWLDTVARPSQAGPMMRRWTLTRGRTRVEVTLVPDEELASVTEALTAIAFAYDLTVDDVVRMAKAAAPCWPPDLELYPDELERHTAAPSPTHLKAAHG